MNQDEFMRRARAELVKVRDSGEWDDVYPFLRRFGAERLWEVKEGDWEEFMWHLSRPHVAGWFRMRFRNDA